MLNIQCPDTPLFRHAAMEYLASDKAAMDLISQEIPASNEEAPHVSVAAPATVLPGVAAIPVQDVEPIGNDFICPVTGERLDIEGGYPWDARIHSSKKNKLAKGGRWKTLRGIETKSPGLIEEVEKEFDKRRDAGNVNNEVLEFPATAFSPPPPPSTVEEEPVPLFELPPAPSFTDIVSYVTCRIEVNKNFQKSVDSVLEQFKLTEITQLMNQTPGVVKSFGDWLSYEWSSVEVA